MTPPRPRTRLTRRGLLVCLGLVAGGAFAGARALDASSSRSATSTTDATGTSGTTAPPRTAPPTTKAATTPARADAPADGTRWYEPPAGEVSTGLKRVAGRAVQALAATGSEEPLGALDPTLFSPTASRSRIAAVTAPLRLAAGSMTTKILYVQLAGLTGNKAAAMVICHQRPATSDKPGEITRTVAVHLERRAQRWLVTTVESIGGSHTARPARLPIPARAVLDHPGIQLPDSARWDIYRGEADERVLRVMAALADRAPYAVTVLKSGHPEMVFGTARISNHAVGRAVDIYLVGDQPVVAQRRSPGSLAYRATGWLLGSGTSELGSPWTFGKDRRWAFTNAVHQDHIHVGFDA